MESTALPTLYLLAAMSLGSAHAQQPADDPPGSFRSIALHDVRENVLDTFETDPEESAVDQRVLANLFSWLQEHGYRPVSLQQIVDARTGGKPLPPRAVLLSFDDGYRSLYTRVYPLLRQFRYPAVAALTTEWLEGKPGGEVDYGGRKLPRDRFVSWKEVREMADSGLVEFASHTHALHRGIVANPQGNLLPAAVARKYDAATGRYETDAAYEARVTADLRRSAELIRKHTGRPVRAIAWPYGAYNEAGVTLARKAGMSIGMTLDDGPNTGSIPLDRIRRALATYQFEAAEYAGLLRQPDPCCDPRATNRVMQIDLDYVYDPDPVQQEANLSVLLERVHAIAPTSVFLQAFADHDGDGAAEALYFPNRHMPVKADLFSRVAWQLRTRTHVKVYAWMPVSAFEIAGLPTVTADPPAPKEDARIPRLSPFDPQAQRVIKEIYEDLGRHAWFEGVLFHDDARLQDDEDASSAALKQYAAWGLPTGLAAIRADSAAAARWSQAKTAYLIDFTQELSGILRRYQPNLLTARNLYARPVLDPSSEPGFSQTLPAFLAAYHYTALMAMPYMEEAGNPERWLEELATRVLAVPGAAARTIFELQSVDWRKGKPVDDRELGQQFSLLHRRGIRHLGYYPDDFIQGRPGLAVARDALSVRTIPGQPIEQIDTPPSLAPGNHPQTKSDRGTQ